MECGGAEQSKVGEGACEGGEQIGDDKVGEPSEPLRGAFESEDPAERLEEFAMAVAEMGREGRESEWMDEQDEGWDRGEEWRMGGRDEEEVDQELVRQ
jgi:hypothetical protein